MRMSATVTRPSPDHRFQGRQKRFDPLGNVDDLDPHREVFGQFQESRRVQVAAAAVSFCAADYGSAGDAPVLAKPDDGRIQWLPVPLVPCC